jgi:hypothetical protein
MYKTYENVHANSVNIIVINLSLIVPVSYPLRGIDDDDNRRAMTSNPLVLWYCRLE